MVVLVRRLAPGAPVEQVVHARAPHQRAVADRLRVARAEVVARPPGDLRGVVGEDLARAFVGHVREHAQAGHRPDGVVGEQLDGAVRDVRRDRADRRIAGALAAHVLQHRARAQRQRADARLRLALEPARAHDAVAQVQQRVVGAGILGRIDGDVRELRLLDVVRGQAPLVCAARVLPAGLPLTAQRRRLHLARVLVDRQVGRDVALHAFAPAQIGHVLRRQLPAQRDPGRRERLAIVGVLRRVAARGLRRLAMQARVAHAGPDGPVLADLHRIAQVELGAAFGAVRVGHVRRRLRRHEGLAVARAGAGDVVGLVVEAARESRLEHAGGRRVAQRAGRELAGDRDVEVARLAALVVAAEVPDRVLAVRAEGVAVRVAGGAGRVVEAVREREVVVADQPLLQRLHLQLPVGRDRLREAQRHRVALQDDRQRPRLVVQVDVRIDRVRIGHDARERAERRHAGLRLQAVLELELQQAAVGDAPVGGQRRRLAVALVVAEVRVEPRRRQIQARAELALVAEALAEVGRDAIGAVLRPQQRRAAQVDVGPLDDQVDDAARRAGAGLHAAEALEHLDIRLVLERQRGLGVDRQPVAAEVALVVDLEAAHRERRPVADRVVRVGDAGVDAREVGQRRGADVGQRLGIDDVGLDRRARKRLREAGDAGAVGRAARGDLHALHRRGIIGARGARERENGRGERREGGTETLDGSHRALSKRWQGNGVGIGDARGPCSATASLREDYLGSAAADLAACTANQVQRDFLSQPLGQHP